MRRKASILITLCCVLFAFNASGAYLIKFPHTVNQPDGQIINCFVTGDEYYNWLHDDNNFTIVQDKLTGYYCYAICQNDQLIASTFIVGVDDPVGSGIQPGNQLSPEQVSKIRSASVLNTPDELDLRTKSGQIETPRTLNNIVIYIRFADQEEFEPKQAIYNGYFNSAEDGANSMNNYFREASYQKLNIVSSFYPSNNGTQIASYRDNHTRNYYCPLTAQNDSGYSVNNQGEMMKARKFDLIKRAINFIKNAVPSTVELDSDNDGKVDNVCFIVRGAPLPPGTSSSTILWPHANRWYDSNVCINSKLVYRFNFQIEGHLDIKQAGVLCHEMFHTIGGGDLYRCDRSRPVGPWDLMAETANPPQSMCADYKYRYGRWISSIPEITQSGHYTLNPITSAENNCYSIHFSNRDEYFMLEFRQKLGTFESSLPGTGLIIYRIDKSECCQNDDVNPALNWIYIYRPEDNINEAFFDASAGRSEFHNTSIPASILSNGSPGNVFIKNIIVSGNTVSFDVRFCNLTDDVLISETAQLLPIINAMNSIETKGNVIVKSTDNVIFEAGNEILLNPGFEIQGGGQFETSINCCGDK